jgi:hypothetical protein
MAYLQITIPPKLEPFIISFILVLFGGTKTLRLLLIPRDVVGMGALQKADI